jgi:hypothetical protein
MVLLFDAYTDHNAQASPAPWGGKYLSADNEVKFGNKSESDMFQENQKVLFLFCMNEHKDIACKCFGNKKEIRLVGRVRKLMEYGIRVFGMLNSLLMMVLFLRINIMWIATEERSV